MIFPKGGVEAESTILFGKYQICRIIGIGRKGTVFLARHLGLEEFRAIKRVPKNDGGFYRETSVLKNLKHPGIPIIYDLEEDSNYYYLIEEYLEGESLYALINRQGSLTGIKVVSFGIELCQIMDYLHSLKPNPILYLDLQPHNILICKGTLKLIDFDQAVSVSQAGMLTKRYGTPGCAAPEQYTDQPMDVRTDIYAIGALLHYMLKGNLPDLPGGLPDGQEAAAGIKAVEARAGWQERLEAIIRRCLCARREERYGNVREMLEDLVKLKQGVFNERQIPLLRIAVVGSSHGMGVTHVSLSVSSYLAEQGILNLYLERNDSGAVSAMADYMGKSPDLYGIFHIRDWELKPRYGRCVRLEQPEYDAAVEDCGTELQTVSEEEYDLLVLVCGGNYWEMDNSIKAIRLLARKKNLRILFNHVSSETDIVLPEDITKLIFYRMPGPAAKKNENTSLFYEAVAADTEAENKIRKLTEKHRRTKRRGSVLRRGLKEFFRTLTGKNGNKNM